MNRARARRVLATVATTALLTLPAHAAFASPPDHANAGGNATANASRAPSEDADGDDSSEPDHEFGESRHPSGRDRTDHQDRAQGNAQSDPDDDGVGMDRDGTGEDQPGADGGEYTDDQDANNGCGNDQDFEDDNNGWCGRPETAEQSADQEAPDEGGSDVGQVDATSDEVDGTPDATAGGEEVDEDVDQVDVAGEVVTMPERDEAPTAGAVVDQQVEDVEGGDVEVLGLVVERPEAASAPATTTEVLPAVAAQGMLPRTGVSTLALGFAGLGTIGAGAALARRRH